MSSSQIHMRSISLPSRLQPTAFEDVVRNLKSCTSSKAVLVGSDFIQSGLLKLAELYTSVGDLAQFPASQHSLSHQDGNSLDEMLSSSVEMLDSCTAIRELVQMMRESVQTLQSALRRKGLDNSAMQANIAVYLSFRKKMNKSIAKSFKALKKLENKNAANPSMHEREKFIPGFTEINRLTIAIFRSILMSLSWTDSKPGAWNLVSKLMLTKPAASGRDQSAVGEVGCMDLALNALLARARNSNDSNVLDVQMLQGSLKNLVACAVGTEIGLEKLFRQLVRVRVTLLNILTDH